MVKIAKKAVDKKKIIQKVEGIAPIVKDLKTYPEAQPGKLVRVHEKIIDVNDQGEEKQRIQVFEGIIIHRKHGNLPTATITVRKVSDGVGVEKIYPVSSPSIEKIEVVKTYKVRRKKLGYLRNFHKKLKEIK